MRDEAGGGCAAFLPSDGGAAGGALGMGTNHEGDALKGTFKGVSLGLLWRVAVLWLLTLAPALGAPRAGQSLMSKGFVSTVPPSASVAVALACIRNGVGATSAAA